jgi:hypothetical protein
MAIDLATFACCCMEVLKSIALVYSCFPFMEVQIVSNLQFALNCSILILRGWGF